MFGHLEIDILGTMQRLGFVVSNTSGLFQISQEPVSAAQV